jgi:hypothetical protein
MTRAEAKVGRLTTLDGISDGLFVLAVRVYFRVHLLLPCGLETWRNVIQPKRSREVVTSKKFLRFFLMVAQADYLARGKMIFSASGER